MPPVNIRRLSSRTYDKFHKKNPPYRDMLTKEALRAYILTLCGAPNGVVACVDCQIDVAHFC